jgi:hypothetical protein
MLRTTLFRAVVALLLAYIATFFLMSVDVIVRVWVIRAQLGSALDAGLLIFFESARALTTLLAMLLIAAVVRRGSATVGARAFALLLAFLTIWYTKAFSFASFPGFAQEKVALWLLAEGVSRRLLAVVFGEPAWALWLALGAFVRVSVLFPQVLAAEAIERPESARRAGMMRSVAFAGADVGEAFRRLSGRALREGWLGPLPVWSVTVGAAAVHYVIGRNPIADAVLGLLFVCGLAVGITALRAGYVASVNVERQRIVWVAQAALTAVLSFMLAATLSAAVTSFAEWLSLGLMTVAPLFVLLGVATAVMPGEAADPRRAVRMTALYGATLVVLALLYAALDTMLPPLGSGRPVLRSMIAAALAGLCFVPTRSGVEALGRRLARGLVAANAERTIAR